MTMNGMREEIRMKDLQIDELEDEINGGGNIETVMTTNMGTAGNFDRQLTGGMRGSILHQQKSIDQLNAEIAKLQEKHVAYKRKNKALQDLLNEEATKFDKEIAKCEQLLNENKGMKTLLSHQDRGIRERDQAINERDLYIDKIEAKLKDVQQELAKKDILLKQTSSKGHAKNSRSTMLNPMLSHMAAAIERRAELREEL